MAAARRTEVYERDVTCNESIVYTVRNIGN